MLPGLKLSKRQLIYGLCAVLIYFTAVLHLSVAYGLPVTDILPVTFFTLVLSIISWGMLRKKIASELKPLVKSEPFLILIPLLLVFWYVTWGTTWLDSLIPATVKEQSRLFTAWIMFKKVLVFVLASYFIYRVAGFTTEDFGLKKTLQKLRSRDSLVLLVLLFVSIVLFQLFFSRNGKLLMQGTIAFEKLLYGIPLCFFYLLVDVGLVEEFFFRGFLQSRLTVFTKSATGGIVLSALLFALMHVPGLWLRSGETEGMESMPLLFWMAYCIVYMGAAGIFLGIIYHKTKNLWLVMILHAMLDLVPNLNSFIKDML